MDRAYWNDPAVWAITIVFAGGAWVGIGLSEVTHNASLALLSFTGMLTGAAAMWLAFKRAKARRQAPPPVTAPEPPPKSDEPIRDKTLLRNWFVEHKCCPDCQGTAFLEGPSGGMSTNVRCDTCGSEFNITLPYFAERISEPGQGRRWPYGLADDTLEEERP
jgi:hypothetical protein